MLSLNSVRLVAVLPVTLIGGYLGSGKTTLVNHLLRHADGLKLAVLVNEFGELPIDADLIEAQDDDLISIAGGCICCSYGDDMLEGIQRLRDMPVQPDHLIIEASGVAMPQAIAAAMSLVRGVLLHAVVVIADAENLHERSRDRYMGDTVTRQLASADLLILNRCDLANAHDKQLACGVLAEHALNTPVIETSFGSVPVLVLLDRESVCSPARNSHSTAMAHASFKSAFVPCPELLDVKSFGERLLSDDLGIVRAKGFVLDKASGELKLLQVAGKRLRISAVETGMSNSKTIQNRNTARHSGLGVIVIGVVPRFNEARILEVSRLPSHGDLV